MAYIYIDTDIDVDVNEYFDSMSEREKKEMLELLSKEYNVKIPTILSSEGKNPSIIEEEISSACTLISQKYFVLENSDLETIVKISQKLV